MRIGFSDFAACLQDQQAEKSHIYSAMFVKASAETSKVKYPSIAIVYGKSVPPNNWLKSLQV